MTLLDELRGYADGDFWRGFSAAFNADGRMNTGEFFGGDAMLAQQLEIAGNLVDVPDEPDVGSGRFQGVHERLRIVRVVAREHAGEVIWTEFDACKLVECGENALRAWESLLGEEAGVWVDHLHLEAGIRGVGSGIARNVACAEDDEPRGGEQRNRAPGEPGELVGVHGWPTRDIEHLEPVTWTVVVAADDFARFVCEEGEGFGVCTALGVGLPACSLHARGRIGDELEPEPRLFVALCRLQGALKRWDVGRRERKSGRVPCRSAVGSKRFERFRDIRQRSSHMFPPSSRERLFAL